MKKVRVAVLGYGHLGKWHCQKVVAHSDVAEFVAIVEKFPSSQEAARSAYPNVKVVSDIKEVIHDIDAAFIVTPTSVHFELVKFLIENKKHVFCEKPLCSNDKESLELMIIAKKYDRVIQVGHSERFHAAWEILHEKLQKLKAPYVVRLNRAAPFKGRATDVDVVQDLAIHDFDLLLYLLKQKPISVKAIGQKIRTNKWDHAQIYLELEGGSEAHVMVGRNHVKEMRELEIISKDGMIFVDLFTGKIFEGTSSQFADGSYVSEASYEKRDHLLLEHKHFYDSILNHKPAIVTLEDGIRVVHLIDLALQSMETSKKLEVKFSNG